MLGPAIVRGKKVTTLQNGNEISRAMLLAIRTTQTSITFETFEARLSARSTEMTSEVALWIEQVAQ